MIVPLLGGSTAIGIGIRNSVDLAIRQANEQEPIPGWRIELAAEDDAAKPDVGAQAATKLASDADVVGVVGTYNSSVALQVRPILDTPASSRSRRPTPTTPSPGARTRPARSGPTRTTSAPPPSTRSRAASPPTTPTTTAKVKNVVIIHDKKAYGQGLAESFQARFEKNGGTVVARSRRSTPDDKDFSAVRHQDQAPQPRPDLLRRRVPRGVAQFSSQAKEQGVTAPAHGRRRHRRPDLHRQRQGRGQRATSAPRSAPPPSSSRRPRPSSTTTRRPATATPTRPTAPSPTTPANVIISALAKVLPGKDERSTPRCAQAIVEAVQATSFDGVTGKVAFDQFGDTVTKVLTVYKVADNDWKPVKTGEFTG